MESVESGSPSSSELVVRGSTIVYNSMEKIQPLQVCHNLWIGPLSGISEKTPSFLLNLTSEQIKSTNKMTVYNAQLSSSDFQSFVRSAQTCIRFIEKYNYINTVDCDSNKIVYICCRNGYSRCLVALALYQIYIDKYSIEEIINDVKSYNLYVSQKYLSFLKSFYNIAKHNITDPNTYDDSYGRIRFSDEINSQFVSTVI